LEKSGIGGMMEETYKYFAENHDLFKPLEVADLRQFNLDELGRIKHLFWERVFNEVRHDLQFIKKTDGFYVSEYRSEKKVFYNDLLVFSESDRIALPGVWIEKARLVADNARAEQAREEEIRRQNERKKLICQLSGKKFDDGYEF
jgi:hypothetical protein